jgi:hypothetical protein
MTVSAPPRLVFEVSRSGAQFSTAFHWNVTIGQSVSRHLVGTMRLRLVKLYRSDRVIAVSKAGSSMPKLSHYVSYIGLAAALLFGFLVTVHAGAMFG